MKKYFPLFINIEGKKCLVIGGGNVAFRKVQSLLSYNAHVVLVAPDIVPEIDDLAHDRRLTLKRRKVTKSDLKGTSLIFTATNNRDLNATISQWAQEMDILVNVVDDPELCTFIMPATLQRGALHIAVSTSGEFPRLAATVRNSIAKIFDDDFAHYLKVLADARRRIINEETDENKKHTKMRWLCGDELYRVYKEKGTEALKRFIQDYLDKT